MSKRRRIEADPDMSADYAVDHKPDLPYHVKYRPQSLNDVMGQDAVVKSIRDSLKRPTRPHTFMFTGPSGTGKTTLSRIIATAVGCLPSNVLEVDAASNSGVDAMREVTATLRYQGFGDTPNRAIIIDEAHALSKQAWQSMLKPIEEPPPHVFFFICTTEANKVPETIVTRCQNYLLKPVRFDDIMDLLERVAEAEGLSTPTPVLEVAGRACSGSPRQALVMLSTIQDCKDVDEAHRLVETAAENKEVIDLCRLMIRGDLDWRQLTSTLKAMPEMPAESIRIVIVNYLAACAMGAKSEKEATRIVDMLHEFSRPFPTSDKLAPLLLAFGNLIL